MTTHSYSPTAALLIIGNEILTGRTVDKNASFLAKELFQLGILVKEIRVIPDEASTIIDTVRTFSKHYTYVFSTGGLGPTHDDITSKSMADAFDKPFDLHEEANEILMERYGDQYTDARKRMAMMPRGVKLLYNPASAAPGFMIENVFVLPGVPNIMQSMFRLLSQSITPGPTLYSASIVLNIPESAVSSPLRLLQEEYPHVELGSYPFFKQGHVGTCVVARTTHQKDFKIVMSKLEHLKLSHAV